MIDVDDPRWNLMRGLDGGCGDAGLAVRNRKHPPHQDEPPSRHTDQLPQPTCAHCGDGYLEHAEGNLTCRRCNSIVGRQLDYGAEWRYYGAEDPRGANPTRCCPPSNGLISTLGSVISAGPRRRASQWQNRTETNAAAAQATCAAGRAVQRYQVWNSLTYRERVLCGIFDLLTVNAAQNGLPACILEEAKNLYKRVSDARITRGENRAAVIAVSVYVACKKSGVPRSIKEIALVFDVRPAAMTKAVRAFGQVVEDADEGACCAAGDFVGRFCSRLGLGPDAIALVRHIVTRADEMSVVCDAMPPSIVAGAIALAGDALGLGLSREAIAAVCVVAPVTVAKTQKRLASSLGGFGAGKAGAKPRPNLETGPPVGDVYGSMVLA